MADTVQAAAGAPGTGKGVAARLIGVITSPGEAMREIVAKPNAAPPLVVYLVCISLLLMFWGMRANWEVIVTDQIENFPLMQMAPDQAKDQAVQQAVERIRLQTRTQLAIGNATNALLFITAFFHLMAVFYATLFVLMGSLTSLRLGRAWLQFGLCLLLLIGWGIVQFIAGTAFGPESQSATMLAVTSTLLALAGWIWLMMRHARTDEAFHKVLSVCTYATAIGLVGMVVAATIILANPATSEIPFEKLMKSSVGSWVSLKIPILDALLRSLDVFTLWLLAILTIGFRAATGLSAGVAAMVTLLPWGVIVLIKLAWAAATGS